MTHWALDSFFYHIYLLGFCGAPVRNDFHSAPVGRLEKLYGWLDHFEDLGVSALYLGPLFESSAHGYDTANYFRVDRRLGDNATLTALGEELHRRGLRLIVDGVFNHTGRDFWAFRDLQEHGEASAYAGWFDGLDFSRYSPYGDPFAYQGWEGNLDLVKLNLGNPAVRGHLLDAVEMWVREFGIDGLRLDVAYLLDLQFLEELGRRVRSLRPDFWLMGEVIHGDYRRWLSRGLLDSVTNYECYKGLYSSLNDRNYYEIAYSLNRQFGADGLYSGLSLYAFVDNHDVDRVASSLKEPAHLYPLYCLLFTMPGVPSLYYGSEWGIAGRRSSHDDRPLRPSLELARISGKAPHPDLPAAIARLSRLRASIPSLRYGDYHQLLVRHEQLAFLRRLAGTQVIVALNAASEEVDLELSLPAAHHPIGDILWRDLLNPPEAFPGRDGRIALRLPPFWARVLCP
jgi:glycosidase